MADKNNPFVNNPPVNRYTPPQNRFFGPSYNQFLGGAFADSSNFIQGITFDFNVGSPYALQKQPKNVNYLYGNFFKLSIMRLPKLEYFVQRVSLPSFGADTNSVQNTRFVDLVHPVTNASFDSLTVDFLLDEDMETYKELYDWMRSIYLIKDHKSYESDISKHFCSGTLTTLNHAQQSNVEIRFKNLLPISLSPIEFDSTITDMTPLTSTVTFAFDIFEIVGRDC